MIQRYTNFLFADFAVTINLIHILNDSIYPLTPRSPPFQANEVVMVYGLAKSRVDKLNAAQYSTFQFLLGNIYCGNFYLFFLRNFLLGNFFWEYFKSPRSTHSFHMAWAGTLTMQRCDMVVEIHGKKS